ncbi:hypothetical protein GCM10027072_17550 [Streptomyces bullii]
MSKTAMRWSNGRCVEACRVVTGSPRWWRGVVGSSALCRHPGGDPTAVAEAELAEDAIHMPLGGAAGDHQAVGDPLVDPDAPAPLARTPTVARDLHICTSESHP